MLKNIRGWKAFACAAVTTALLFAATYVEAIQRLPLVVQIVGFFLLAYLQLLVGTLFDFSKQQLENFNLRQENRKLHLSAKKTRKELSELENVVVSFLEYSAIYREKIKDFLKLKGTYLCIVKSSEGLSKVFQQMEEKEMLPFGSVLSQIPGAIRPFERIGLFLIPTTSLPGITDENVREYIDANIVPLVEIERREFLKNQRRSIASQADEFSYKYIAFFLRPDSIVYDVRNRKFNHEFNSFIVGEQSRANLDKMTSGLEEIIKTKDVVSLADWAAFAKLNKDQSELIEQNKRRINDELTRKKIVKLTDLSAKTVDEFFEVIWPVLKTGTTEKKARNISKKVVEGAQGTIEILRKHGVNW